MTATVVITAVTTAIAAAAVSTTTHATPVISDLYTHFIYKEFSCMFSGLKLQIKCSMSPGGRAELCPT